MEELHCVAMQRTDEKELMMGSTDQGSMIVFLEGDNITKMIDDLENPE